MADNSSTFLTVTDDDGNSYELEHLDTMELDGRFFMAFLPADVDPEDERYGLILMEAVPGDTDDDQFLQMLDEDEEERIYDLFMERLFADEDEEDED